MKIKFAKLPTTDGIIKVSLDGGQSFTDYNVVDVHESGIPLEDNQDYEKIQIQAPANVLKNLDIVASVKVEGEAAEGGNPMAYAVFGAGWRMAVSDLKMFVNDYISKISSIVLKTNVNGKPVISFKTDTAFDVDARREVMKTIEAELSKKSK